MPDLIRAFGAAACDSDSTYVSDDFGGAALWLPPGVEADIETLGRLIGSNADSAILSDVDAVFDAMARSQLISVRLMSRARRANAPELAYFQHRYFVNGALTHHFAHMHLRPADQPAVVQSVLDGSNNDPRDQLLTVVMIVWRFRNDLFRGEKWAYQLQGQLSNFTHANAALMRLLERHEQLAA